MSRELDEDEIDASGAPHSGIRRHSPSYPETERTPGYCVWCNSSGHAATTECYHAYVAKRDRPRTNEELAHHLEVTRDRLTSDDIKCIADRLRATPQCVDAAQAPRDHRGLQSYLDGKAIHTAIVVHLDISYDELKSLRAGLRTLGVSLPSTPRATPACDCGFTPDVCETNHCHRKQIASAGLSPVPAGYSKLPDGVVCKCFKMWRAPDGSHWCCLASSTHGNTP